LEARGNADGQKEAFIRSLSAIEMLSVSKVALEKYSQYEFSFPPF
jgi:hypothetical protein